MISVKVLNAEEVARALEEKGVKARIAMQQGLREAAMLVEREAKLNITRGRPEWPPLKPETIKRKGSSKALIDTGTLRASITHKVHSNYAEVGPFGVKYAVFQEYGTRYIPPRPFLRPALYENVKRIKEIIKRKLRAVV